jgi:hypothetical protein
MLPPATESAKLAAIGAPATIVTFAFSKTP